MAIRHILHANIDVHGRRSFADFPGYGIECIKKLQSYCANITFAEKKGMIEPSSKKHITEGNHQ